MCVLSKKNDTFKARICHFVASSGIFVGKNEKFLAFNEAVFTQSEDVFARSEDFCCLRNSGDLTNRLFLIFTLHSGETGFQVCVHFRGAGDVLSDGGFDGAVKRQRCCNTLSSRLRENDRARQFELKIDAVKYPPPAGKIIFDFTKI